MTEAEAAMICAALDELGESIAKLGESVTRIEQRAARVSERIEARDAEAKATREAVAA